MDEPVDNPVSVFFVGPGKCGTSWVYGACRSHAALNVGRIKEPGEFLTSEIDLDAYHRLWNGPGIRCDFSNTYFFSEAAAEGIYRYNRFAKICITVRSPVSRLVSQYMFMCRNGRFSGPIADAITEHPEIVDRCRFDHHANRWLKRFPAGQIIVLRLETLRSDPDRYKSALFEFLEVPDSAITDHATRIRLPAAMPRSRLLARGTKELAELARRARLFRLIEWVKRSPLVTVLYKPLPRSYQQAHLQDVPDAVRIELEEEYSKFLSSLDRHGNVRIV